MTTIDLLTIDPHDPAAVRGLVEHLHDRLTADQCRQLLSDLEAWNRHHARTMRALEASPEWREVQQWRAFILEATREDRAA